MSAWAIPAGAHVYLPARGEIVLTEPLDFGADVVPEGFHSDLASTPWFLWWILPPWGVYRLAAILHDYHYRNQHVTRAQADALFLYFMVCYNVSAWKRAAIFVALRGLGWWAWGKNRKALAAQRDQGR